MRKKIFSLLLILFLPFFGLLKGSLKDTLDQRETVIDASSSHTIGDSAPLKITKCSVLIDKEKVSSFKDQLENFLFSIENAEKPAPLPTTPSLEFQTFCSSWYRKVNPDGFFSYQFLRLSTLKSQAHPPTFLS